MDITVNVPELRLQAGAQLDLAEAKYSDVLSAVDVATAPRRFAILAVLARHGGRATFKQIEQETGTTGGVLGLNLRMLQFSGLIDRISRGEYVLTLKGSIVFAVLAAMPLLVGEEQ